MENEQNTYAMDTGKVGRLAEIDFLQVKKSLLILRAINHTGRQQILKLLEERGKLTATEIYVQLRLEQSVASQHLAILRSSGVVETRRDGKKIHYSINDRRLIEINVFIESLLKKP